MPIRIRDNDHINELRATVEMEALRHDMTAIVDAIRKGRSQQDIGDDELQAGFERASPGIERSYGIDVWDAMMLLAPDWVAETASEEKIRHSEEWELLYSALSDVLSHFGKEDPYGDGDYWIVDEDYGHPSQKVCVSKLAFLEPEVIEAVQRTLKVTPHWAVLLQVDEKVNGIPASSTGMTIRHDGVERHFGTQGGS